MSRPVTLVRLLVGTELGRRVETWSLRVFGKEVAALAARQGRRIAATATAELAAATRLVLAGILVEGARIYPRLLARHPKILAAIDQATFVELLQLALLRGNRSLESLRGLLVERLLRTLPEVANLERVLNRVVVAANKRGPGWSKVRMVSGVVDGHGKEVGDLLMVATHEDGRLWVLAVLESKSLSNTDDLARLKDLPVGQHLWDLARARTRGLVVEGRTFKPGKVVMEPVPIGRRTGADAVVGVKAAADRAAEMAGGHYTQFIGFTPREMTKGEIRRVSTQGIQIESWPWPFDLADLSRFQKDLINTIGRDIP